MTTYYSSMKLEDYVNANWEEMDDNLVQLIVRENILRQDIEDEADHWHDKYSEMFQDMREISRALNDLELNHINIESFVERVNSILDIHGV